MTYEFEIQIEELRERREIQTDLELARPELAIITAEQDGSVASTPSRPSEGGI